MKTTARSSLTLALFLALFAGCGRNDSRGQDAGGRKENSVDAKTLEGNITAPEFPDGLEWLNTDRPVTLAGLRGKVVLLDFWTYCCINCMHIIPDLKKLEEKYADALVVIGVHSAKFQNEKGTENIRKAILRYEIRHPVVNDKDFEVWEAYGARAWPTLVLINPRGKIIGGTSGEGVFDQLDPVIGEAVKYFDAKKELKKGPYVTALEAAKRPNTLLSFPGKIASSVERNELYITDSNHNRILVISPDGMVKDVIGEEGSGFSDGGFESARFNHPQGTAQAGDLLYICDTENHAIRVADLKKRSVETLAGTGSQAPFLSKGGTGRAAALNSPWDALVHEGKLYIAMAGTHQLWTIDLDTREARPYAGSGREGRKDGPFAEAWLAQPSGITTDGKKLYFADSETSSIRSAGIGPDGEVRTIVGEDLFVFGDVDGAASVARLQHPLGVVWHNGKLFVADTYNCRIKLVNPEARTSRTYAGTGTHGEKDGNKSAAEFDEPGGMAALGDVLYIADTNNHLIRTIDMRSGAVRTLELKGVDKLARRTMSAFTGRVVELAPQTLRPGEGKLAIDFRIPAGYHLTTDAPLFVSWSAGEGNSVRIGKKPEEIDFSRAQFPLSLPAAFAAGSAVVTVDAVIYYCKDNSSVCMFEKLRVKAPVTVAAGGSPTLAIGAKVNPSPGSGI